uniref:Uncharacterized protein n=1 Tax=Cacopsylla melanoneura TaxID=428564 RepID=A0A8D8W5L5_9HEMI
MLKVPHNPPPLSPLSPPLSLPPLSPLSPLPPLPRIIKKKKKESYKRLEIDSVRIKFTNKTNQTERTQGDAKLTFQNSSRYTLEEYWERRIQLYFTRYNK